MTPHIEYIPNTVAVMGEQHTCRVYDTLQDGDIRYTIAFAGKRRRDAYVYPYIQCSADAATVVRGTNPVYIDGATVGVRVPTYSLPAPVWALVRRELVARCRALA